MLHTYREVWLCDSEFRAPPGERPQPLCLVATELHTGRTIRFWKNELLAMSAPPFACDASTLFVAFYASAEFGCFLTLGWPFPIRVLDLFIEFRCQTNGMPLPCGSGLLGALAYFGIDWRSPPTCLGHRSC